MKKLLCVALLSLSSMFLSMFVFAEGCFHDAINVVDKPGYITRGANVRNAACMYGTEVVGTLKAGTKVRIVGQTAWTKIVMPDGKVGWVGNDFVAESSDTVSLPNIPANHLIDSYCDTTNPLRCPYPSAQGVVPEWYYLEKAQSTSSSVQQSTSTSSSQTTLSEQTKGILDSMVKEVVAKVESKYTNLSSQIDALQSMVSALPGVAKKFPKLALMITYLQEKLEEQIGVKELKNTLDI